MFSSRNNLKKHGFTLLEIMLAVAVLGMVAISIYRFVDTTLTAVRVSTEKFKEDVLIESFTTYLRDQMQSLPQARQGAITGDPHRFNDISSDELRWIARAGSGLLTRHAAGEWNVTLTTKQISGKSGYELGLRRQDINAKSDGTWLPLFSGVRSFEARYYDPRSQEWMEKWTDITARPTLVRVRLWRDPMPAPMELVLPLPASKQVATAVPPNGGGGVGGVVPNGNNGNNGNGNPFGNGAKPRGPVRSQLFAP